MTPRENFQRMMRRDRPGWLPLDLPMTPPVLDEVERRMGTRDAIEAFHLDFSGVHVAYRDEGARWRAAYAQAGIHLPENCTIGFAGITHLVPPAASLGKAYHLREMAHPLGSLTTLEQVCAMPWPDLRDPGLYAHLPQQVASIHAAGRVAVGQMACTAFEFAWYVRGMDVLFADLVEENGIGDWLLDWFAERAVIAAEHYCRAGVDVIVLGDDVGTQRGMMMSVPFWRRHIRPRLLRVIEAIRSHGLERPWVFYHSDGDIRPIVGDLADMGVDILNPVQPECMPLDELVPRYQDRLAFWGLIGTQTTMPFGTPQTVRAAVEQCAAFVRDGAAVIVAPTHVLEPDVPWENIRALVDAVRATRLVEDGSPSTRQE